MMSGEEQCNLDFLIKVSKGAGLWCVCVRARVCACVRMFVFVGLCTRWRVRLCVYGCSDVRCIIKNPPAFM